jgi:hypothetical protein
MISTMSRLEIHVFSCAYPPIYAGAITQQTASIVRALEKWAW